MNNKLAIGAIVLAFFALAVGIFRPAPKVENQPPLGREIQDNPIVINGVATYRYRMSIQQGTSTLCFFRAPLESTSTLSFFSVNSTGTSTSAGGNNHALASTSVPSQLVIAKAATPFTTTTAIDDDLELVPNFNNTDGYNTFTLLASTAPRAAAGAVMPSTFGPGEFAVVKVANSAAGDYRGYNPTGACEAEWVVH